MPIYGVQDKARARALFEIGQSMAKVATQIGCDQGTIHKWVHENPEDVWKRGVLQAEVEQAQQASIIKIAEEVGLTQKTVCEKIVEFQNATKLIKVKENPEDIQGDDGEQEQEIESTIQEPDYKIQIEGNKQAIDVLGMKVKENLKSEFPDTIIINSSQGTELARIVNQGTQSTS